MNLFTKPKLKLTDITAPLHNLVSDLEALKAQHSADITEAHLKIEAIQTEADFMALEHEAAHTIQANLKALLGTSNVAA